MWEHSSEETSRIVIEGFFVHCSRNKMDSALQTKKTIEIMWGKKAKMRCEIWAEQKDKEEREKM